MVEELAREEGVEQAPAPVRAQPNAQYRGLLFADLRGFTEFVERQGNEAAAELLSRYRSLVRAAVARYEGAEVKTEGDSFYVVFPTATSAVLCGVAVVEGAAEANRLEPGRPIRVGVGVHAGESVETPEGFVGVAVNVAARVCAEAAAGEVIVTESLRAITGAMPELSFEAIGRRRLKGVRDPIMLYRIVGPASSAATRWSRLPKSVVRGRPAGIGILGAGVAVVGIALLGVITFRGSFAGAAASLPASTASAISSLAPTGSPGGASPSVAPTPFILELTPGVKIAIPGGAVAISEDAVWVADGSTLRRVDPRTNTVAATLRVVSDIAAMSASGRDIWVTLPDTNQIVRIDGRTNEVRAAVPVFKVGSLATGAGSVWVTARKGAPGAPYDFGLQDALVQVDMQTNKVVRTIDLGRRVRGVLATPEAIWVSGDAIWRVDPAAGNVIATFNVESGPLALGAGSIWVVAPGDSIVRLDPSLGRVQARLEGPRGVQALAFGEGSLWASGSGGAPVSLLQIDPATNRVSSVTRLHETFAAPSNIAIGFSSIWVCDPADDELWRVDPRP